MLSFLFGFLIWIIIGFLTINLALFIWRVLTPFARMYYKNDNGDKSYFGYVRKTPGGIFEIIDAGKMIGDKKIGTVDTSSGKAVIKFIKNDKTGGGNYVEDLGYVDTNGDIYDAKDVKIAKCDVKGSRNWRYLWLMHRTEVELIDSTTGKALLNTGYCTESLRFGDRKTSQITLLAKASAALVLCEEYIIAEESNRIESTTGAKDLAFPAALIYVIFYSGISMMMMNYHMFPALGDMISYVGGMLILYFILWWTLYMIKTDFANRNVSFSIWLNLINRNTGVSSWNFWLILFSLAGLISSIFIHGYLFVPLFAVVLIGVIVNWFGFTAAEWQILEPSNSLWKPEKRKTNKEKVKTIAPGQQATTKTIVKRDFSWDLKSFNITNDPNIDKFELEFYKEDFDSINPDVRIKNPFFGKDITGQNNWEIAVLSLENSIKEVLTGSDILLNETTEMVALNKIINSANDICIKYSLSDFELYELLLYFCQSKIKYVLDGDSLPIQKAVEYVRFPTESLYDTEGDCDCKSALAYKLFEQLGVEVKFAIVSTIKESGRHAGLLIKKDTGKVKLPPKFKNKIPNYPDFVYCEATGEGWKFGELPSDIDLNSLQVI